MSGSSYDLREISTNDGEDVRLYTFKRGDAFWRYASGDRDVSYAGDIYSAIAILDDGFKQKGQAVTDDFTITVPSSIAIPRMFVGTPPSQPIKVQVRLLQYGDNFAPLVWTGFISSVKYRDPVTSDIVCNTQTFFLNRRGLRLAWTRGCTHNVYGPGCGLGAGDWAEPATITALYGNAFGYALDAQPSPARWDNRFAAGFIEWNPDPAYVERRGIQQDDGSTCILLGAADGLTVGMAVRLLPGCTLVPSSCRHFGDPGIGNISRYGGFGMLPGKSPFDGNPVF